MRSLGLLTAVLALGTAYSAFTPYNAYSQTLDGQMQRMQGQPAPTAEPMRANAPYSSTSQAIPGTVASDSTGSGAIPSLPLEIQDSNGVTYINGGISDEEVAELKAKKRDFNVHVLLSAAHGEFISDVALRVLDGKGSAVVNIEDAGPYIYMKLPAGHYTLEAADRQNNVTKKMQISVAQNGNVNKQFTFGETGGITTAHNPTATID